MTKFKKAEYTLFVYQNGTTHPMTVDRSTVDDCDKWLKAKRNQVWLKECSGWVVKNAEDYEVRKGKVSSEVIYTIVADE